MRSSWNPKPGDQLVRQPRQAELGPVTVEVEQRETKSRASTTPMLLIYSFAALVLIATLLLSLPFTHHGENGLDHLFVALFTATSAVTVTGLVVQDTATYWTTGGQLILAGIIFVGGLGFMTLATFAIVLIGQQVTLSQRLLIQESFGGELMGTGHGGLVRLAVGIVTFAVVSQAVAFAILAIKFWGIYPPGQALLQALFQAVSAFNNAGFIIFPHEEGMAAFQSDGVVIGVTAFMIFLGAISYGVLFDIVRHRKARLFGLTTKLVLAMTAVLILLGVAVFMVFEYRNPETLGHLPVSQKVTTSLFESVSGRTAGFSTLDYSETEQETNFMMTGLMFIGGASASVAGGLKVNTLAVVLVAVFSTIRGISATSAFDREIPARQVRSALVIGAIATAIVFVVVVSLSITDGAFDFLDLFFEGVSAFGTVGLSTGVTPLLSQWGQLILIIAMFVGRVGPFTIGIAMAQQSDVDRYRFVEERVTIG